MAQDSPLQDEVPSPLKFADLECPYVDDVVYTVVMHNGWKITGRFTGSKFGSFWSMEVVGDGERNAADWIDVNPAYIAAVYAAAGEAYRKFVALLGDES